MVHGERLLLVEDDAATREVLTLLLAGEGWAVSTVESGELAVEAVSHRAMPAVVLCDLHLPGLCGQALAERLRTSLDPASVVLAMTATAIAEAPPGYDGLVVKPFAAAFVEAMWRARREPGEEHRTVDVRVDAVGDEPVLDLTTLEQLRRGMGDAGVRGLYAFALGDAGDRMDRMTAAVAAGDAESFTREAHALKGSCGMIGARAMRQVASDAEMEEFGIGSEQKLARLRVATEAVRLMLEVLFPV